MADSGAGFGMFASLSLAPASLSVRAGSSTQITASMGGSVLDSGTWTVTGGSANGTISAKGLYTAPAVLPSGTSYVTIRFVYGSLTNQTVLLLLNPVPTVSGASVTTLTQLATPVTITGSGFIAKSQVMVNGIASPTTYVDTTHLSTTLTLPSNVSSSVSVQVFNPTPGSMSSSPLSISVAVPSLSVSPAALTTGNVSLTVTQPAGIPTGTVVTVGGVALRTTSQTSTSVSASGYLPPWTSGNAAVALVSGSSQVAQLSVPVVSTPVSFDTASRFATQTGFGPRMDVITHIQQIGLAAYVDEQEQTTPDPYNVQEQPRSHFMRDVLNGNDQLRKRLGWIWQVLIPEPGGNNLAAALQPWETTLEAHAFGGFRQILQDALSNSQVASLLTLPNNFVSTDPTLHPNQNFGREVMQLFSVGTILLNDDGSPALDAHGAQQATYTQNDVADAARVLTGWTYPSPQNPDFTDGTVDASLPLVPVESGHDHGSKTVLGTTFPAGQTTTQDRSQFLDVLLNHPNTPPFVSKQLIQRLVKSQPSPAYIYRISQVFKNDGTGVRGNLGAVVKAILLDPEARAGDNSSVATDGIVQDPVYQELAAMTLLGITAFDDQPIGVPLLFKEPWWNSPSVFSYFSPNYLAPGTTLNSPEFQILDTVTVVQRSQLIWGMINATFSPIPPPSTQLYDTYPNLTSMMDALNHLLFHGAMPQSTHDSIVAYCSTISDPTLKLQSAVFLALNSDNYNVVQ
jgi:uncharacterized protein (DUF1800 family)